MGSPAYPGAGKLLIASGSGSPDGSGASFPEGGVTKTRRRDGSRNFDLSPAARDDQMEQNRTPAALVRQSGLARQIHCSSRSCPQSDRSGKAGSRARAESERGKGPAAMPVFSRQAAEGRSAYTGARGESNYTIVPRRAGNHLLISDLLKSELLRGDLLTMICLTMIPFCDSYQK